MGVFRLYYCSKYMQMSTKPASVVAKIIFIFTQVKSTYFEPHQTPFHSHQIVPKYFDDLQSSPTRPHTGNKKTGAYRFPERTRLTFFGADSVYNPIKAILTKRVFLLSTSFAANSIDTVLYRRGIRNRRWAPMCPKLLRLSGLS